LTIVSLGKRINRISKHSTQICDNLHRRFWESTRSVARAHLHKTIPACADVNRACTGSIRPNRACSEKSRVQRSHKVNRACTKKIRTGTGSLRANGACSEGRYWKVFRRQKKFKRISWWSKSTVAAMRKQSFNKQQTPSVENSRLSRLYNTEA